MAEIASAYVSLIPSARGFGTATSAQINPQMRKSGATSGALLGKSMLKAFIAIGVVTKIAGFVSDALDESREGQKVGALVDSVIKSTGGAAHVSAAQIDRLSNSLKKKIAVDDEAIASSAAMLLTFKNITRAGPGLDNVFGRATRGAYDLAAAMHVSADSATKQLGKALNDPIKGLTALTRAGVGFTAAQAERIKGYVAEGNILRAQKVILNELESQVKGAAESQATNAERAAVAYADLKQLVGDSLRPTMDALAGVFADRIAPAITTFITNLKTGQGQAGAFGNFIRGTVVPALQRFWEFIVTKVAPAMRGALASALKSAKSGFNTVRDAVRENRPQLEQLGRAFVKVAVFVQTQLIPAVIKLQAKVLPVLGAAIKLIISAAAFWVNRYNQAKTAVTTLSRVVQASIAVFTLLATAVRQKATNVVETMKALPGKIKAAVGSLGHLLYSAGQAIIQGLIDGITSKIGAVKSKLHELTNLIPDHKGPPAKDKALLYGAGQLIIDGLIDGMASREKKVTKHLKELTKKIKDQLATVRSDFASLVEPISSAFTGNLFEATTGKDFVASLLGTKGQLTGLLSAFKTLIGQGLSPGFLYQLFQSGNAGLILDLAAQPDLAAQAGSLFGDVSSLSNQLGTAVAGATDKGAALEGQTVRLEKKLDKLIHAVNHGAERTGDVVNGAAGAGHRRGKQHGGRRAA